MKTRTLTAAAVAAFALTTAAGAQVTFVVPMSGTQEVAPVIGDPDGFGTATLTITPGSPPSIVWSIEAFNITLPPTAAHIHSGAAGTNGPVVVDFSAMLSGGPVFDPDLANVLANPAGFYVNVHTPDHTGGAIRGQIPTPSTVALLGLAGAAAGRRRRR